MMKKVILFSSIFLMYLSSFAQISTDSLVLYLPFNGNANDTSGNGFNGTVNGATLTEDRFGNANSAYSFNGISDYIIVTGIPANYSEYTFAGWIKGNTINLTDNGIIVQTGIKHSANDQLVGSFGISASSGSPFNYDGRHREYSTTNSGLNYFTSQSSPDLDWHFYVLSWNGDTLKFYIDNLLQGETPDILSITTIVDELIIGAIRMGENVIDKYFDGIIDDIRIYNKALSEAEITSLYNENTEGISLNYNNSVRIFPNPATDFITIDIDNNSVGCKIIITNALSQLVFEETISQLQYIIDLSNWIGNGIYFVQLFDRDDNLIDIKKIVVQ